MNDAIEAEHRPLAVRENYAPAEWTPSFARSVDDQLAMLKERDRFYRERLKEGVHYGIIPGTEKPTLYKPGAEALLSGMGLRSETANESPPVIDFTGKDHDGEPFIMYDRYCRIYRQTGPTVNDRIEVAKLGGACNSWEPKYRYRNSTRVCPQCGKDAIIKGKKEYGGGWVCFKKKDGCNAKFSDGDASIESQVVGKVPNEDVAELQNTIKKMADKRALIAATLVATGCSDIFTQDVEDMQRTPRSEPPPPAPEPPGPTPREQAHLDAIEAVLAACRQGNVKAPARGVLDGKSVVELLAYRDRVLAARAGDSKPAGGPPASQPTQEPLAAAASATEPANASEFPGPGGPPMSLKTQRHLFAVLGELGYDTKQGAHRGWLSSLGLGPHADAIESFALLSEAQAAFLARKAVEERDALKWECPACGTFDNSKHSADCPERDFTKGTLP